MTPVHFSGIRYFWAKNTEDAKTLVRQYVATEKKLLTPVLYAVPPVMPRPDVQLPKAKAYVVDGADAVEFLQVLGYAVPQAATTQTRRQRSWWQALLNRETQEAKDLQALANAAKQATHGFSIKLAQFVNRKQREGAKASLLLMPDVKPRR